MVNEMYGITKTVPPAEFLTSRERPTEDATANRGYVKRETMPRTVPPCLILKYA